MHALLQNSSVYVTIEFFLDVRAQLIGGANMSSHSPSANVYTVKLYIVSMFFSKNPGLVMKLILISVNDNVLMFFFFSVTVPFLCNFAINRVL